ncbi:MAG: response regulator [Phycisphaerales bacterium]|nr:response regulator [Phycisphaerales bacterium]
MHNHRPTILVIDNDEGVTTALSVRLDHAGYRCVTACTGAQGLARFREDDIDLVITDLNMPALDGVELTRSIRQVSQVPIVIITGFHADFKRNLRNISNVTVLQKPFDIAQLLELIEVEIGFTRASAS